MTKQPAPEAEAEVVQTFSFTFFCPYNTRTFSRMLKRFAAMNHFATTKLVKLKTHKHHEDEICIWDCPKANLFIEARNRVIKFEISICVSLCYMPEDHSKHFRTLTKIFKVIRGSGYVFSYYEWYLLYFRKIEELSLLTTEPVMERNNSRIGSIVAEDGYDDHSEGLTETIKTDIPPLYSKILMEAPVTSYQRIFLI